MYKIRDQDQKESGPFLAEVVRQWVAAGRADASTPLHKVGDSGWKPLSHFPEFQHLFAKPEEAAPGKTSPGTPTEPVLPPAAVSRLAITSLILGVLGLLGITALAGLVTGVLALKTIARSGGRLKGTRYAIGGSVLSGSMLLLSIPLLTGLLLVPWMKAKQQRDEIRCLENVRILTDALLSFAEANEGRLPSARTWSDELVQKQLLSSSNGAFRCPAQAGVLCSYAFNTFVSGLVATNVTPECVLVFESDLGWNGHGGSEVMAFSRHDINLIVGFADGTVRTVPAWQLPQLRWQP